MQERILLQHRDPSLDVFHGCLPLYRKFGTSLGYPCFQASQGRLPPPESSRLVSGQAGGSKRAAPLGTRCARSALSHLAYHTRPRSFCGGPSFASRSDTSRIKQDVNPVSLPQNAIQTSSSAHFSRWILSFVTGILSVPRITATR